MTNTTARINNELFRHLYVDDQFLASCTLSDSTETSDLHRVSTASVQKFIS